MNIGPASLRRIDYSAFDEVAVGLKLLVCQTPQWMNFLCATQKCEPLLAELTVDGERRGIFTGAIVRKAGLRILGSPLRGWTTSYMGFALRGGQQPNSELGAMLRRFAFRELRCTHLEMLDRTWPAANAAHWDSSLLHGFEVDLQQSEEQLLSAMSSACRRCIRKGQKCGLIVEEVHDPAGFAHEYHSQLLEVFARQRLVPPYPVRRVGALVDALHPHGMLLLLRALDPDGRCIATAIFPGYGSMMYFWGGASRRAGLQLRPNEALMWHAMRLWRKRGVISFDMGGGGSYKAKYGGRQIAVPWLRCSRNPAVAALRWGAEKVLRARQRALSLGSRQQPLS